MIVKRILLYFWQLPQNLAGFILSLYCNDSKIYECSDGELVCVYKCKLFRSAVSLGDVIIADNRIRIAGNTLNHEHGHQKQSRMLGPLYLIVIGLPSLIGNIIFRIFKIKNKYYYRQPWEAWADKLGGVER